MKTLLLFLLSALTALGQSVELRGLSIEGAVEIGSAVAIAPTSAYLIYENYETNSQPAYHTNVAGTVNYYSTAVALEGSHSCMLTNESSFRLTNFGSLPELWVYWRLWASDPPSAVYNLLSLESAATSLRGRPQHRSTTGAWRAYMEAAYIIPGGSTEAGVTYHCWLYYRASNSVGALDQELWFEYGTNATKQTKTPGASGTANGGGWAWNIGGTNQAPILSMLMLRAGGGGTNFIDRFILATNEIPDDP